jgi:thiamine pyrophosphate-dependent acetolactate synthase large subunit-like protein
VESGLEDYGGASSHAGRGGFNGSDLSPSPDFAAIARACGAYGETVADTAALPTAMERALGAVKEGQSAVIDAIIRKS